MSQPVSRVTFPLDFSLLSFLVVDDQPFSRRLLRSMLHGFGTREVYETANGAEGFEAARNVRPNIIITDMVMPIFNGLQFLKMTREPQSSVRDIPIIVLSGYLTKPATLALRELGADELLVKPVSPKALYAHIVRTVLNNAHASQPLALAQHQRWRTGPQHKRPDTLAYL
jgi:two-component system, chemotaxis family, chemotaxis protein CheY